MVVELSRKIQSMTMFLQNWHLILLVSGITIMEAANTNQIHSDWKGPWEVHKCYLPLKAVAMWHSDWVAQVFSQCIFKTFKDGDRSTSLQAAPCWVVFLNGSVLLASPLKPILPLVQAGPAFSATSDRGSASVPGPFQWVLMGLALICQSVSCVAGPKPGCSVLSGK